MRKQKFFIDSFASVCLCSGIFFLLLCYSCTNKPKPQETSTIHEAVQGGKQECSIGGDIAGAEDSMLTLMGFVENDQQRIDSLKLSKEGTFKFILKPKSLDFYRLKVGSQGFINLMLDTDCSVNVHAHIKKLGQYILKGCEQSELFALLDKTLKSSYHQTDSINNFYHKAEAKQLPGLGDLVERMEKSHDSLVRLRIDFARRFAKEHYSSPVAISATQFLDPMRESDLFVNIDTNLMKHYSNNRYVKDFHSRYGDLAKKLPIGSVAPDIVAKDPLGKTIKLSSLRGKYVIIDFWASWCAPCRKEAPNMVALYKKYKSKGLEVFGFSLDKNLPEWQQAIMHDNLTWKHASDLREWHSAYVAAYYVQGIPYTCLLDKNGKVLAKGLTAEELDHKLSQIFTH